MERVGRIDNGLSAPSYVPLVDASLAVAPQLLAALTRARIPAYLEAPPSGAPDQRRLYVATSERADARTIVTVATRAASANVSPDETELHDVDLDADFQRLVAGWEMDEAVDLTQDRASVDGEPVATEDGSDDDDMVWLDEGHYEPPVPPELPKLAEPTIWALAVLCGSILILAFGGYLGLANQVSLVLGMGGLLWAAWLLFNRLRRDGLDEDDDGAVV